MPRFAALDIGSNALRLRIVEAPAPNAGASQLALLPRDVFDLDVVLSGSSPTHDPGHSASGTAASAAPSTRGGS